VIPDSAALGLSLSGKKDPNKDSPLSPHLIVPVGLRNSAGDKGYQPYIAHINFGAIYNFILQAIAYMLSLEAAKAGNSK
jgi:hypothetical protein